MADELFKNVGKETPMKPETKVAEKPAEETKQEAQK